MEALLPILILLACPVGMGLMMWFMAKGSRAKSEAPTGARRTGAVEDSPMSLEVLREEHRRLGEEIGRLEERPAGDRESADRR